jgi:hypothetical protein
MFLSMNSILPNLGSAGSTPRQPDGLRIILQYCSSSISTATRNIDEPTGKSVSPAYGPVVIHSTAHPKKAWVIRVTGTDLDELPRYHFGKDDRMLAQA